MHVKSNEAVSELRGLVSAILQATNSDDQFIRGPSWGELSELRQMAIPGAARPIKVVLDNATKILSYGLATAYPKFFSCMPSLRTRLSWLGDCLATDRNPFSGGWDAGSGVCTIESSLVGRIAEQSGLPSLAGGKFVSGASMANLAALAVARDRRLEADKRANDIACISGAHFCIQKGVRICNCGKRSMKISPRGNTIPYRGKYGTRNTGTVGPFAELAKIAKDHHMWLHVNTAYGGSAAFSEKHCQRFLAYVFAHSIAWNTHKLLFKTHACGAVFFRQRTDPLRSFSGPGDYVRDVESFLNPGTTP
ncbi:hypothetical protein N7522_006330 [Penicillium canescens]|nr:hypothetical protein N7522_006330 [Penicillium canescens]